MTPTYFDFHSCFDQWVADDDPPTDFKFWVIVWLMALQDDPTANATRAEQLDGKWWFASIPNAEDADRAAVCLYSIDGDVVRCSGFSTLRKPVP